MKRLLLPILAALALPTDVKASTYNLICTADRSHQISYLDKVNDEDELTQIRSKYKEDITSRKKLKVSYNLKNNNGFIENNPAKAIRIFDPNTGNMPLFLYFEVENYPDFPDSSFGKLNKWNIRIDRPTRGVAMYFFSIKSLKEEELIQKIDASDEIKESLDLKFTHEISSGFCYQIK